MVGVDHPERRTPLAAFLHLTARSAAWLFLFAFAASIFLLLFDMTLFLLLLDDGDDLFGVSRMFG